MKNKVLIGGVVVVAIIAFLLLRGGGNVALTAQTDKESYAVGERVTLTLSLTNAGTADTCISDAAAGSVVFTSVKRDGEPVTTRTAPSYYLTSLSEIIKSTLTTVVPGESIDITLTSSEDPGLGSVALFTTELDGTAGIKTFYDIGAPGSYELEVTYSYPGDSSEECSDAFKGSTNAATVLFTVNQ